METRIGQLLFGVALLAGLMFASPYAPWDELKIKFEEHLGPGDVVLTTDGEASKDPKQAKALQTLAAQLLQTMDHSVWPTNASVVVHESPGEKGEDLVVLATFQLTGPAGVVTSVDHRLLVTVSENTATDKAPREFLRGEYPLTPSSTEPFTFDELLNRALGEALHQARLASNIAIQNLIPQTRFQGAPTPCDPKAADSVNETGLIQECVLVDCPPANDATGDAPKACGRWQGIGTKPPLPMPQSPQAADQWNVAIALRRAFADPAIPTLATPDAADSVRGDFGPTDATATVRTALYGSHKLPEKSARPTTVVTTSLKGTERDATLVLQFQTIGQPAATPTTVEAKVNKPFPSTSPIFWGAMALAVIGCVLWRVGKSKEAKAAAAAMAASDSVDGNPFALLRNLMGPARTLGDDIGTLSEEAIMERVDTLLSDFVLPFAEVRSKVTESLGMSLGAEILVVVAYGERMLNRVWTAASDGHPAESRLCYPEVLAAFEQAHGLAASATGAGSVGGNTASVAVSKEVS